MSSTITMASAPSGSGAPVMMRIASPGPTARSAGARRRPRRPPASSTGACGDVGGDARRSRRPRVLANGGTSSAATTSPASTSHGGVDGTALDTGRAAGTRAKHVVAGLVEVDHSSPHGTVEAGDAVLAACVPAAHEPAGHVAAWATWDGDGIETTTLRWENEGWTVSGEVGDAADRERIQYVLRLSATWQVRQFLLFRDLDEPDLWLATDGGGRWGEMNGAHRTELDGCTDIDLAVHAVHPHAADPPAAAARGRRRRAARRARRRRHAGGAADRAALHPGGVAPLALRARGDRVAAEFDVDEYGLRGRLSRAVPPTVVDGPQLGRVGAPGSHAVVQPRCGTEGRCARRRARARRPR